MISHLQPRHLIKPDAREAALLQDYAHLLAPWVSDGH